jgi:hypothetical protein
MFQIRLQSPDSEVTTQRFKVARRIWCQIKMIQQTVQYATQLKKRKHTQLTRKITTVMLTASERPSIRNSRSWQLRNKRVSVALRPEQSTRLGSIQLAGEPVP